MKMDQIAYYCANDLEVERVKAFFGLQKAEWLTDRVTAHSIVHWPQKPWDGTNVAELQFNYTLGTELEILRYVSGRHWMPNGASGIFISHIGIHLGADEDFPEVPRHGQYGGLMVQETWTQSHTAKYLTDPSSPGFGRKYHYRIHCISPGNYVKYIKRVPPQ